MPGYSDGMDYDFYGKPQSSSIYQTAGGAGPNWWWADYLPSMPSADTLVKGGGLGLLGLLGAGMGQSFFGGGSRPTTTRTTTEPSAGQQGAFSSLQSAVAQPSLPPGLSLLAEQAFQPAMGDIASQAIMSARRRGFSGGANLLQEGPAGAIAGPALADLQPQMAAAKLALYQNWINNLMQAQQIPMGLAQGYRQAATAFQPTQVMQAPKPSILDTMGQIAPILSGIGSIFGGIWK